LKINSIDIEGLQITMQFQVDERYAALQDQGFQIGSISRIRMKNFLTYDECEVKPGPKLNVVIGPNGTGKSAMTHAICLACGGSTGDVGRANDLSKFVKHGAEGKESFVEVDIFGEEAIITVRRTINSDNKGSKWTIDGKIVKQADVKSLMTSLSIDVDNLCSFMPQDKVGNFSRFTPKEILKNTLLSIEKESDERKLSEEQMILSEIQDNKDKFRRERDSKQLSLTTTRQELESLQAEMDRMERRETLQKQLNMYKVKKASKELDEADELKQEKERLKAEYEEQFTAASESKGPLEVRERNLKRQQATRDKNAEDTKKTQRALETNLRQKLNMLEQYEQDIETASEEVLLVESERAKKQAKIEELNGKLSQLDESKREAELNATTLAAAIEEKNARLRELRGSESHMFEEIEEVARAKTAAQQEVDRMTRELNGLEDSNQKYRGWVLKNRDNDAHRTEAFLALDWLTENMDRCRQEGDLRGEVVGPVGMHCDVASEACAMMLENHIPNHILLGFVVDNEHDAQFLRRVFRNEKRWKIDIFTVSNMNVDSTRMYSQSLLDSLDFKQGYLSDQLVCPDIVRALLNSFCKLHQVIWREGSDNLTEAQQRGLLEVSNRFTLFIHQPTGASGSNRQRQPNNLTVSKFVGKVSAHSGSLSTQSFLAKPKGLLFNKSSSGEDIQERRQHLTNAVAEKNQVVASARQREQALQRRRTECRGELQLIQGQISGLRKQGNAPQDIAAQISRVRRSKASFESQLSSLSVAGERGEKTAAYEQAVSTLLDSIKDVVAKVEKSNKHQVDLLVATSLKDELMNSIRQVGSELAEANRRLKDYKRDIENAKKAAEDAGQRMEEKENEVQTLMQDSGLSIDRYLEEIYPQVQALPETTMADIVERMNQIEDDVNDIHDNPQVHERAQRLQAKVAKLEAELAQARHNFDNAEEAMQERAHKWERDVGKIAKRLNDSFSSFMGSLQLGGEVRLREVGKFEDYELQIRVKFREASDMAELDGNKHSGGERAVSTVMYLMALQELTSSPFRVVDEINQGMDESNERLVFDRIVDSCCDCDGDGMHDGDDEERNEDAVVVTHKSTKPQYFLVTPKLLQGLVKMNNDDVTVLLLLNGPGTEKKWDFADVLKKLIRKSRDLGSAPTAADSQFTQQERDSVGEEEEEEEEEDHEAAGEGGEENVGLGRGNRADSLKRANSSSGNSAMKQPQAKKIRA